MSYPSKLKVQSPMKKAMNKLLWNLADESNPVDTYYIVIDAITLLSFRSLQEKGVAASHIIVINDDPRVIRKAKKAGSIHSKVGMSTDVLKNLPQHWKYKIVYLDYCRTTQRGKHYCPEFDVLWASTRLAKNGTLIMTYSRRKIQNVQEHAEKILSQTTLGLPVKVAPYFETSAMLSIIASNGDNLFKQRLSRMFNLLKTEDDSFSMYKTPKAITQSDSNIKDKFVHDVDKRLGINIPPLYSVIAYWYYNRFYAGIVTSVTKKKDKCKILWVDPDCPREYLKQSTHNILDQVRFTAKCKETGNWCFLYDTFDIKTEEDKEELSQLPLIITKETCEELIQKITDEEEFMYPLAHYFGVDEDDDDDMGITPAASPSAPPTTTQQVASSPSAPTTASPSVPSQNTPPNTTTPSTTVGTIQCSVLLSVLTINEYLMWRNTGKGVWGRKSCTIVDIEPDTTLKKIREEIELDSNDNPGIPSDFLFLYQGILCPRRKESKWKFSNANSTMPKSVIIIPTVGTEKPKRKAGESGNYRHWSYGVKKKTKI